MTDVHDNGGAMFWSGRDAVDRPIHLAHCPQRIISLVPSQTELLIDLGVGERLVGRTRYCIHPAERVSSIDIVGGTKKVDISSIRSLQPDLILGEKEENPKEMVEELSAIAPVYVTDVVSIPSAIAMCRNVGEIVGTPAEAQRLAEQIAVEMNGSRNVAQPPPPQSVLYLIWRKPWMAAGTGTFIHACLEHIGLRNVIAAGRYPEIELASLAAPDRVFLSSEPFPFKSSHVDELREHFPQARIELVDGEMFSWYGSRMLKMPAYWRSIV